MEQPEHPAQPEQEDSFEKGHEQKPDSPEENLEPDFARGEREREGEPGEERNFAEGIERPGTREKMVERRFSEGIEHKPDDE